MRNFKKSEILIRVTANVKRSLFHVLEKMLSAWDSLGNFTCISLACLQRDQSAVPGVSDGDNSLSMRRVTGRKWWHIGMYCPLLKPVGRQLWLQEFKRDDDYIEQLEEDLWQFKLLVDGYEAKLRSKAA